MPTSASSGTLATYLEEELTDRLLDLEKVGREKVRDQLTAQLNPTSDEASTAARAAHARVQKLSAELKKRPAFPWSHPLMSAAAFETVQASVVQCWLVAGEPAKKTELVPAVREYIRFQTNVFSSAIGADRKIQNPFPSTAASAGSPRTKKASKKKSTKKKR